MKLIEPTISKKNCFGQPVRTAVSECRVCFRLFPVYVEADPFENPINMKINFVKYTCHCSARNPCTIERP